MQLALAALGAMVLLAAAASVATALWVQEVVEGISLTMPKHVPGVSSVILDTNGKPLAAVASTENRFPVRYAKISPWLRRATVAIEDRRFYQHGGLDYEGISRALWADVSAGAIVQGGSTIEQQVARLLYLDASDTLTRKVQEADLAMQLAQHWSRRKILTTYLNIVPYGGVIYGCQAAAHAYFDRSCARLSAIQAATLAGLPQSPTGYNPEQHPGAARLRRNEVLAAMAESGYISAAAARRMSRRPIGLNLPPPRAQVRQPYFVQYVEQQLAQRFGTQRLQTGGLVVKTTIDPRLQGAAWQAFHAVLDRKGDPAAALVAMDPRTGAILAFDASTNPNAVRFDLPSEARRQAGSAFKPFALLASMIDDHIDPDTTYYAATPFKIQLPGCNPIYPSCTWKVNNAEPGGSGSLTLHQALDGSVNAVFGRLSLDIGAAATVNMAYRMGIPRSDHLPVVPSIVLGTGLVSPLDMATAYSTMADGGVLHRPLAITNIRTRGGRTITATPASSNPGTRVIPAWAASELTSILADNITCRLGLCTGGGALLSPYRAEAGKTGTVEAHLDAWFCGYTPDLATCVWMGFPSAERTMMPAVGVNQSFGGGYPATMWRDFMTAAFKLEPQRFPPLPFPSVPAPAGWFRPWTSHVTGAMPLTGP